MFYIVMSRGEVLSVPAVRDTHWSTVSPTVLSRHSRPERWDRVQSAQLSINVSSLLQTEMAGEEELSMLLSTISSPAENIELSLEQIHQILSLPPEVRTRTESLSLSSPESGIGSTGDFPDDLSPWPGNSSLAFQPQQEDYFEISPQTSSQTSHHIKLDETNGVMFPASETSGLYNQTNLHHLQQSQPDMASILKQLTAESSELLLDSEVDLQRLERVKNNFKTTTLIGGENFHAGGVPISGPNHTELPPQPLPLPHYQQSVIVRNIQAASPAGTNTNQAFSVDFNNPPMVINLPQREAEMVSVEQEKDQDIFQNFEIVSPKKEVVEYLCYCCGEKAGKHSYYGGQVCASCRAFFRRSVQSKYYEIFQCKFDKNCKITSQTRKTCQFCR